MTDRVDQRDAHIQKCIQVRLETGVLDQSRAEIAELNQVGLLVHGNHIKAKSVFGILRGLLASGENGQAGGGVASGELSLDRNPHGISIVGADEKKK